MKTIKVKTFNLSFPHDDNNFFILSKGYNAGKPLDKPCPNCFIITADNIEHKHQLFWVCYALWKSGKYLPLLCGSVIPFLHIRDASDLIEKTLQDVDRKQKKSEARITKLKQLIHTEKLLNLQLKLISEMKAMIAQELIRKGDV